MTKCLLLIVLFFTLPTHASIRVIGNGGGEDEMHALSYYAQALDILSFCTFRSDPCSLTEPEKQFLRGIKYGQILIDQQYKLDFHKDGLRVYLDASKATLSIRTDLIEDELSMANVFEAMLWASSELTPPRHPLPPTELKNFSLRLSKTPWDIKSVDLGELGKLQLLHLNGVSNLAVINSNASEAQAYDFMPLIASKLNCQNLPQNINITGLQRRDGGFSATLIWTCKEQAYQALMFAQSNTADSNKPWNVHVRSRSAIQKSCGTHLTSSGTIH